MKYKIKYDELKKFLETLTYRDIKDGALTEAHAMSDIEMYYKTDADKSEITYDQVIDYGMPYLVDAIGNDLSVCILTKRKYKLPTGRVIKSKLDRTVIDDCRKVFGSPLNSYWVIPDRFIEKEL